LVLAIYYNIAKSAGKHYIMRVYFMVDHEMYFFIMNLASDNSFP